MFVDSLAELRVAGLLLAHGANRGCTVWHHEQVRTTVCHTSSTDTSRIAKQLQAEFNESAKCTAWLPDQDCLAQVNCDSTSPSGKVEAMMLLCHAIPAKLLMSCTSQQLPARPPYVGAFQEMLAVQASARHPKSPHQLC